VNASVETERLLLRPLKADDLPHLAPIWADPEVMRYIGAGETCDDERSRELLGHLIEHWDDHGFGLWAVVPKAEQAPVGWAGLAVPTFLPAVLPAVEAGWLLAGSHWGRGYATEAALASLAFGFDELGLERIISIIYPANAASIRVAEKLGMTPCGTEQHPRTGGGLRIFERFARATRTGYRTWFPPVPT
jgi:RimJ/RimL family protein N-acetyltransferase